MYFEKSNLGKNQFWRYFFSILIIIAFTQLLGAFPMSAAVFLAKSGGNVAPDASIYNPASLGIDLNVFLVLMILPFAMGLLGLWVCADSLHKKKIIDIITGRNKVDWKRVFFAALIWGILGLISSFASYLKNPDAFEFQFQPTKFIILLFVAFLLIPIQSTFEEVFFRGYLMQGTSLLFKNKWIPLLITSILFGVMHLANPEIKEFGIGIMLPQYILLGLFFGIMVIMDDGLELAIGVHAINNIFGAIFITHKSSVLQTPAIFKTTAINPSFEFLILGFAVLIFLVIVSRKYNWGNWKSIFTKINFAEQKE
ncbi:MAG: CPBP family intramembrane glutamic endopeptidase [Bacteroidales bacterium]|jgi:membrane protease YdiL (CAAX protease family)|nr:CPBP family intramembrane glutamic endopeptidase [Bacteroidales bacterium]